MPKPHLPRTERFPKRLAALALGLLLLVSTLVAAGPQRADSATVRVLEMGASSVAVSPDCGPGTGRSCLAEGRVTGFQVKANGFDRNQSFVAPHNGKLVAWSIQLSRPYSSDTAMQDGEEVDVSNEVAAFDAIFGSPSTARISVLKKVSKKKGQPRYKLVRHGPTEVLNPYFGSRVQFALEQPLTVMKGQVVALTIPTWAPAFWHPQACDVVPGTDELVNETACTNQTERNTWRGSRAADRCSFEGAPGSEEQRESVERSRPQQKVGSVKAYGCYYGGNRLLYTATLVAPE